MGFSSHPLMKPLLARRSSERGRFDLLRYFTLTATATFLVVGIVLYVMESSEVDFFAEVQERQTRFFREAQAELSAETTQAARNALIAAQETANVNLTHFFANTLWDSHFAPFVAKAQALSMDHCRSLRDNGRLSRSTGSNTREECFAEIGLKLRSQPGFATLDRQAIATMKNSNVFKIKVYDLRGLTVYSTDHRNIGEDKSGNAGWRAAAAGRPASELTHRDHFSSFEGMVENRDLVSSYIPMRRNDGKDVLGVFEIYADVTPMLRLINASSTQLATLVSANQGRLEQTATLSGDMVRKNAIDLLRIVGGILIVLFGVLLYIVRRGQAIIDEQIATQEQAAAQERLWHQEKMEAMATMAANVSHETGNALSVIAALAQQLGDQQDDVGDPAEAAEQILEQCRRVFGMTRQISAFATVSDRPEFGSVNPVIEAVCYFFGFDRRFRSPIEFRPGRDLPWCDMVPEYLKEILMNLLPTLNGKIVVETGSCSKGVRIRIRSEATAATTAGDDERKLAERRMEIVRRRIDDMGGTLAIGENSTLIEIELPAVTREDSPH
jgi:signal transduction histidine kinase